MRSHCADYDWTDTVEKDGPVRVGRSGPHVRVEQYARVTGKAGINGALAFALSLSLSGKAFDVRVAAATDLDVGLDERWCPVVEASPVGRWLEGATVEVVGKSCVDIDLGPLGRRQACAGPANLGLADVLNKEFGQHRGDIERAARGVVSCDDLRAKAVAGWRLYAIKVGDVGQAPVFLNIDPRTAAFSGVIVDELGARVVVRVSVMATLSPEPVEPTAGTLPTLRQVAADRGSLNVNVRAIAPYAILKDELTVGIGVGPTRGPCRSAQSRSRLTTSTSIRAAAPSPLA